MGSKPRYWRTAMRILLAVGLIVVIAVVITLILLGYSFDWTGFNSHVGPQAQQYQRAKTLWDWMQLLIVPTVLIIGGALFNRTLDQTNRDVAFDKQREDALQAYLDKMTELLLDKSSRRSEQNDEVYYVARLRTSTVVRRLDASRKESLIRFLSESGLMNQGIGNDLKGIDLQKVDLSGANLNKANLSGANLLMANLSRTDLSGADLSRADLRAASMRETILRDADLRGALLCGVILRPDRATLSVLVSVLVSLHWTTLLKLTSVVTSPWEVIMSMTNLKEAELRKLTPLFGTDLTRADLSGANLSGTDLSGVSLNGADLSGADLSGADLKDATGIIIEELEKIAKSLQGAIMLNGTKHP